MDAIEFFMNMRIIMDIAVQIDHLDFDALLASYDKQGAGSEKEKELLRRFISTLGGVQAITNEIKKCANEQKKKADEIKPKAPPPTFVNGERVN